MAMTTEFANNVVNGESRRDFSFRGIRVRVSGDCAKRHCASAEKEMRDKIERKLMELEKLDIEAGDTASFKASFIIGSSKRVVNFVYDGGFLTKYGLRDPQILMLMADGNQELSLCELYYISEHLERVERCIAMHAMSKEASVAQRNKELQISKENETYR